MKQAREVALDRIVFGALVASAGSAVAAWAYSVPPSGGTYVIAFGSIAAGLLMLVRGIVAFATAPPLEPRPPDTPPTHSAEPPLPARGGAVGAWTTFWHGFELPARTLRVFRLGFFAVMAVDAWLQIEHAPRYGAGGFNVPHAGWIGEIVPMPSRTAMTIVYVLQAYLAVRIAFAARPRWSAGALAALFGYGYFASQLNSYQHHYLMFLALVVCSLIPWDRAIDNRAVRAWAVRLLLVQISLVYAWAAIAKLDSQWLDGSTLERQVRSAWWREVITDYASWGFAATAVMATELALAIAIHVRALRPAAFVVGIALHVTIEAIGFKIGLFSYFMVALYPLVAGARLPWWAFAPGLLGLVGLVGAEDGVGIADFDDPGVRTMWAGVAAYVAMMPASAAGWQGAIARQLDRAHHKLAAALPDPRALGFVAIAAAAAIGTLMWLPLPFDGMAVAGVLAGAIALVPVARARRATWRDTTSHLLAGAAVLLLHATTDQARDHYKFLGGDLRRRGDIPGATTAYETVRDIDPSYAQGRVRLGDLYRRAERFDSALAEYRAALGLDADAHRAYIGEAMIHIKQLRPTEARTALANARAALGRAIARTTSLSLKRALARDGKRIQQLEGAVRR